MPRKGPAPRRPLIADPVYNSPLVTQLINKILLRGKRALAERIVYGALEGCKERRGPAPVPTPRRAGDKGSPPLGARGRGVGGAPSGGRVGAPPPRATTLGLRWLTSYARARREKTMVERL